MSTKILAKQIMTKKVIVANTSNKPSQLIEFMTSYKIQHLPISENDKLVGIVSINDLFKLVAKESANSNNVSYSNLDEKYSVGDFMTKNVTSVGENATLEEILDILSIGNFQAIPVTENGDIRGIISNRDIVRVYDWEKNHREGNYSSDQAGFGV